jgi:hypothetical protein
MVWPWSGSICCRYGLTVSLNVMIYNNANSVWIVSYCETVVGCYSIIAWLAGRLLDKAWQYERVASDAEHDL